MKLQFKQQQDAFERPKLRAHLLGLALAPLPVVAIIAVMNLSVFGLALLAIESSQLIFLFFCGISLDVFRVAIASRYALAAANQTLDAELTRSLDRQYLTTGIGLFFTMGAVVWLLVAKGNSTLAHVLGASIAIAYSFASASRHACRPTLAYSQIWVMTIVTSLAMLSRYPDPIWTVSFGALFGGIYTTFATRLAYQRMVQHYLDHQTMLKFAQYDPLTRIRNRNNLAKTFETFVKRPSQTPPGTWVVQLLDLDGFKQINDAEGHAAGDQVLIDFATALEGMTRKRGFVARLGGDEFLRVVEVGGDPDRLAEFLNRDMKELLAAIAVRRAGAGAVSACSGYAVYARDGESLADLMKKADMALMDAKAHRDGRCVRFSSEREQQLLAEQVLELELVGGIARREIVPWFQMICDIGTGAVVGYEALARWQHKTKGMIPPNVFIPLAERSGRVRAIGEIILREACAQAAGWQGNTFVAVNVSAVQLRNPTEFEALVCDTLHSTGLAPTRLVLEITESALLEVTDEIRQSVERLSELGVQFALDDFGVGYSSLHLLQVLPLNKIKIDKSFVDRITTDQKSQAIASAVQSLATKMGMAVVAEGVEELEQRWALARLGIDLAQGYLFGRPEPMAQPARSMRPLKLMLRV